MSTPAAAPSRSRVAITTAAIIIAVLVILFFVAAGLTADILWYDQLGFGEVLWTRWGASAAIFALGFVLMALPVWLSMTIAYRSRPMYTKLSAQLGRYQEVVEPLRKLAVIGIPVALGLIAGFTVSTNWPVIAQFINATPFGQTDPEFGLDIGFYVFELPFWQLVVAFASAVVLISGIAALATCYLYGSIRFVGRQVRITKAARIQIAVTFGLYLLVQAVSFWFDRFAMLTSASDGFLVTGAGYTEVNASIPGRTIMAGVAIVVALLFLITAIVGRWRLPIAGVAMLLVVGLVVGTAYPWIVQRFQVDPSARTVEAPYITRSIEATRDAYDVADVQEVPYSAVTDAEAGALREDAQTTASIRILDPAIVSPAFSQLEQIKQYYRFQNHLDVDRYEIDGTLQDTVIAVRELNQGGLDDASRSWYNDTVVYTHGYGVVAAYGNQRSPDGQPLFLEAGIPSQGSLGDFEPRVYFGEGSPLYSIVGGPEGADDIEIDYPLSGAEGSQNATTTFAGDGGPKLDNFFVQLVYALKFQSEQIIFSDAVTEDSQILYDRHPAQRVSKVAPYLTLDSDVYPAVVDGRIVWIVDGYTTTTQYPYSQTIDMVDAIADANTTPNALAFQDVNYIRNSVKATVDAYTGEVVLYAWDAEDPVLQTWQKIFPTSLKDASEMSADLLNHVRYPADLFKVQRQILGSYHVTDAGSFYSADDQWVTPANPTDTAATGALQPPYYLTMEVPGTDEPAFTIYSTYIPNATAASSREVLTGYLTANGDAGEDYGKLTLLTLTSQSVAGPGQVQNSFRTDTEVANQLALLQRGDTEVLLGNLLTLPVGGGLLYVQPVYVQAATGTSFPLLRKVLVSFGDAIAFEDTLDEALDVLFGGDSGATAGDGGQPVDPVEPSVPVDPEDPNVPVEPTEPVVPPTGTVDEAALQQALADYSAALADRQAAYAAGDLVAAAEADARMVEAIERALVAAGG